MPFKRWDPFQDLISLHQEMFGEGAGIRVPSRSAWTPAVDIFETPSSFVLNVEAPGVDPDKLKVEFADRRIVIQGERTAPDHKRERKYHQVERTYGPFERSIAMPSYVCCDEIEANFENGILQIVVPKTAKESSRVIKVKG